MCYISPTPIVITYTRFKNYCDFLSPHAYIPFNLLIPVPAHFAIGGSISSVWKPYEISVSSYMEHYYPLNTNMLTNYVLKDFKLLYEFNI